METINMDLLVDDVFPLTLQPRVTSTGELLGKGEIHYARIASDMEYRFTRVLEDQINRQYYRRKLAKLDLGTFVNVGIATIARAAIARALRGRYSNFK